MSTLRRFPHARECTRKLPRTGAFAAVLVAGCAHAPLISFGGKAPAPAPPAAVCPGGLSAPISPEPQLPADADFPAATTPKAASAVGSASRWLTSHSQWGRDGWLRAQLAKDWCDGRR